jgi:cytochrome c1
VPAAASFVLTFNEPNFQAQSNITAEDAAALWPKVEAKAHAAGVPIVSPGVNFCGPAASCNNGTSPYDYLRDFFAACTDCEVDYVAVHWYNCDLPSLKDYLEPGGSLEGFEQFGKPIWLTEFSCDGKASAADQEAYMREAVPYLEANSHVFRYSWFSADPIPNAKLVADDGTPTALGNVYLGLDGACKN